LRVYSDIHLDFDIPCNDKGRPLVPYTRVEQVWAPSVLLQDSESILILAGDLWTDNLPFKVTADGRSWISNVAKRFEHVIVVLGNHDYWGLSLQSAVRKARKHCAALPNVTLLERDTLVHSGVKFLGGTLWTDFNRSPIIAEHIAKTMGNDFRHITYGDTRVRRRVRHTDFFDLHRQTAKYIFTNCKADEPGQKVVIVTHMTPHYESLDTARRADDTDYWYFSNLTESMQTHCKDVCLWVHGHVHQPKRYNPAYGMWVMSNPRGYEVIDGNGEGYEPNNLLEIASL
jgi:predicted phosphohydrolase